LQKKKKTKKNNRPRLLDRTLSAARRLNEPDNTERLGRNLIVMGTTRTNIGRSNL
jgi:hypothetical protein